jgi:hypothetical protein
MSTYHPSHRRVRSGRTASGIRAGASGVFAAATAIGAVGILIVPAPAQAGPMFPLAPACTNYQFNGRFDLNQSNGAHVYFNSTGPDASGTAFAGGSSLMNGDVRGTIQGRHLDFTIVWDQGPAGQYRGDVDDAGFAHGITVDMTNTSSTATWDSTTPLGCVPPPAPKPQIPVEERIPAPGQPEFPKKPQPPTPQTTAKVTSDRNVYNVKNEPDGAGQRIGILRVDSVVNLVDGSCQPKSWCHVSGAAVPTGDGWVWGAFDV